jgi:hypothetical protein
LVAEMFERFVSVFQCDLSQSTVNTLHSIPAAEQANRLIKYIELLQKRLTDEDHSQRWPTGPGRGWRQFKSYQFRVWIRPNEYEGQTRIQATVNALHSIPDAEQAKDLIDKTKLKITARNQRLTDASRTVQKLIGHSTGELAEMYQRSPTEYLQLLDQILFKSYEFRVWSRPSEYEGRIQVQSTVNSLHSIPTPDQIKYIEMYQK